VTEPPVSVTLPCSTSSDALPAEFSCTAPSCEYVPPSRFKPLLFAIGEDAACRVVNRSAQRIAEPRANLDRALALLVIVLPAWMVPLFSCKVEAPVRVTLPPFTVTLFNLIVLALAESVPPALLITCWSRLTSTHWWPQSFRCWSRLRSD